jgi:hypothetical protein
MIPQLLSQRALPISTKDTSGIKLSGVGSFAERSTCQDLMTVVGNRGNQKGS